MMLSSVIGASKGTISIQPNVTTAHWVALSALYAAGGRNKVVYSELDFPSIQYFYQRYPGLAVEVVASPDGVILPLEHLLEAIDEETLAVSISHVVYKSAFIQDVEAIIAKAHSVGAYVILDVYHSCGVVPLDVGKLEVDFATGGVLKWMCGGPGVAFLYVRPDLSEKLEPYLTGWFAHESPMGFSPDMVFTDSSYRFMSGTPNIPGLYATLRGLEIIQEIGVDRIRQRSRHLTGRIVEYARSSGLELNSPLDADSRGGHVTICPRGAENLSRELLENEFVIDYRPGSGIRIAPHFYNTLEEVEQVLAFIDKRRQRS
jgi:kynureninase